MGLMARACSSLWEIPWGYRVLKIRGQAGESEEVGGRKGRPEEGSSRWRARHGRGSGRRASWWAWSSKQRRAAVGGRVVRDDTQASGGSRPSRVWRSPFCVWNWSQRLYGVAEVALRAHSSACLSDGNAHVLTWLAHSSLLGVGKFSLVEGCWHHLLFRFQSCCVKSLGEPGLWASCFSFHFTAGLWKPTSLVSFLQALKSSYCSRKTTGLSSLSLSPYPPPPDAKTASVN